MTIYFIIQMRTLIRLKGKLLIITPRLTWENHDMGTFFVEHLLCGRMNAEQLTCPFPFSPHCDPRKDTAATLNSCSSIMPEFPPLESLPWAKVLKAPVTRQNPSPTGPHPFNNQPAFSHCDFSMDSFPREYISRSGCE